MTDIQQIVNQVTQMNLNEGDYIEKFKNYYGEDGLAKFYCNCLNSNNCNDHTLRFFKGRIREISRALKKIKRKFNEFYKL